MKALLPFFILVLAAPARGGMHFGLAGNVANQQSKVTSPPVAVSTGNSPTTNLPACAEAPLSVSLMDVNLPFHIEPLGHLAPTPHTFPTDHTYFQLNKSTDDTSSYNIYAPARIKIQSVVATTFVNQVPPTTDYGLDFVPCSGMLGRLGHIRTLTSELLAAIGPLTNCTSPVAGLQECTNSNSAMLEAGQVIGMTTGLAGNSIVGLDFGLYDFNTAALPFISPERRSDYVLHTVCPYDSFAEPLRSNLEARFARYDGVPRTEAPLCGTAMQDSPGTAQGNWYVAGTPHTLGVTDDAQLALVHDNIYPSTGVFSVGNSVTGSVLPAGLYYFSPQSSGLINRDFPAVSADTHVYCYDSFSNFLNNDVILIQMPTSATLRIERQSLSGCGSGPWTLTAAATDFER